MFLFICLFNYSDYLLLTTSQNNHVQGIQDIHFANLQNHFSESRVTEWVIQMIESLGDTLVTWIKTFLYDSLKNVIKWVWLHSEALLEWAVQS